MRSNMKCTKQQKPGNPWWRPIIFIRSQGSFSVRDVFQDKHGAYVYWNFCVCLYRCQFVCSWRLIKICPSVFTKLKLNSLTYGSCSSENFFPRAFRYLFYPFDQFFGNSQLTKRSNENLHYSIKMLIVQARFNKM